MIGPAVALALLLVGVVTFSVPAAIAQENPVSLDLEYKRRGPPVPPLSEVEKDAARAAEEIERRPRGGDWMREIEGPRSRRPDLDPDVMQGIRQLRLQGVPRR